MKKFVTICYCLWIIMGSVYSQSIPAFKEGERIAFVGNSITAGGHYHSYIWLYYMTRFPDKKIYIYNEGIGGDVVGQMSQRMDKVFEHNPTVITLSFGMNDTGYMDFTLPGNDETGRQNAETACTDYLLMEKLLKEYPNVRKILIGSSPYDETARFNKTPFPGKNGYIMQISDFLKERAIDNKWDFVDFNRPMVDINKREQFIDSTFTLCGNDRVHPSSAGHLVMAYLFLEAQGFKNSPVADVSINVTKNSVARSVNCKISELSVSSDSIGFVYQASSLPFPIDSSYYDNERHNQTDAMKVIPFMDEINYEGLSVSGLADGYYLLRIAGRNIARFSAQELHRGINLALYGNTPQYEQAREIASLNERRWYIERQMREYFWMEYHLMRKTGMLWKGDDAAVDTMLGYRKIDPFVDWNHKPWVYFRNESIRENSVKEQQELIDRIYRENKPKALRVELVKL